MLVEAAHHQSAATAADLHLALLRHLCEITIVSLLKPPLASIAYIVPTCLKVWLTLTLCAQ